MFHFSARSNYSWHALHVSYRIRKDLQIDERGLQAGVAQPPARDVDGNTVCQPMTGCTVSKGMGAYFPPRRDLIQCLRLVGVQR